MRSREADGPVAGESRAARAREHLASLSLPLTRRDVCVVGGDDDDASFFADRGCAVTRISSAASAGLRAPAVADTASGDDPFDVVFCRDVLEPCADPRALLRALASLCNGVLILEASVSAERGARDPRACPPARAWLHARLRQLFECVYFPRTQPAHRAYPLDWRPPDVEGRALFIASRMPLGGAPLLLAENLLQLQYPPFPHPAVLGAFTDAETIVVDSIFGPLLTFAEDALTAQLRRYGAHTRNEVALLQTFADAGDCVYDIGAHIGTLTLPLAAAVGSAGRVLAVEAMPSTCALLARNLQVRDLQQIVFATQAVVTDAVGTRHRAQTLPGRTSSTWLLPDPDGPLDVSVSLDELHQKCGAERCVALVKVDTEGMDLAALRSGRQLLERDRPVLYVEVSPVQLGRYGATPAELQTFLQALGYRMFRNVAERNSLHDDFQLVECTDLAAGGPLFDVLAVAEGHFKLERALAATRR